MVHVSESDIFTMLRAGRLLGKKVSVATVTGVNITGVITYVSYPRTCFVLAEVVLDDDALKRYPVVRIRRMDLLAV